MCVVLLLCDDQHGTKEEPCVEVVVVRSWLTEPASLMLVVSLPEQIQVQMQILKRILNVV